MRVSDEDRQRAIEELRRHCAAGRIDVDEYSERIERALGAATLEELDSVMGDLPYMRIADPVGKRSNGRALEGIARGTRTPGIPGLGATRRLGATLTVLVTVVVVLAAVLLVALAEWTWAVALIVGWLIGLAEGRLSGRDRHH